MLRTTDLQHHRDLYQYHTFPHQSVSSCKIKKRIGFGRINKIYLFSENPTMKPHQFVWDYLVFHCQCFLLAVRYGFRSPPHIELKARPKLGEREVTLVHVTDWIEKKLDQEFQVRTTGSCACKCLITRTKTATPRCFRVKIQVIKEDSFTAAHLHTLQSSEPVAFPPLIYISKVMIRLLLYNRPEAHLQTTVSLSGLPHIYIYPHPTPLGVIIMYRPPFNLSCGKIQCCSEHCCHLWVSVYIWLSINAGLTWGVVIRGILAVLQTFILPCYCLYLTLHSSFCSISSTTHSQ